MFQTELSFAVSDKEGWKKYKLHGKKRAYSLAAQIRKRLIHVPLDNEQVMDILLLCQRNVSGPEGDRYLAAAFVLLCMLELEEVCALRLSSMEALHGYPAYCGLKVCQEIRMAGKVSHEERRERGARHELEDISDPYQNRVIPMGTFLQNLVDTYRATHPERVREPENFIVSNPKNKKEFWWPESLAEFLNATFGDMMPDTAVELTSGAVSATLGVADYMVVTAQKRLAKEGRYSEEELRSQLGLPPRAGHTDVKHYADLRSPTELVSMADMMDCWVCSLLGTPLPEVHSKKQYRAEGKPKQITSMHVRLEIPPETVLPRDLYLALQSRFGLALALKRNSI